MRRGFSLVELMIAVSLLALLAAIVLPSAADSLRRGQMARTFDALDDALAEASAESMRTGRPVELELRPGRTDREGWSLWMRVRSPDQLESGEVESGELESDGEFGAETPSSGERLVAFPADVEIGSETEPLTSDAFGQVPGEPSAPELGNEQGAESIILALALPDGRAMAGQTLRLDETQGDRSWLLSLRPLSASFGAEEIDHDADDAAAMQDPDEDNWEDQLDEFGLFEDDEDVPLEESDP